MCFGKELWLASITPAMARSFGTKLIVRYSYSLVVVAIKLFP